MKKISNPYVRSVVLLIVSALGFSLVYWYGSDMQPAAAFKQGFTLSVVIVILNLLADGFWKLVTKKKKANT